jgi:hypothetical protein
MSLESMRGLSFAGLFVFLTISSEPHIERRQVLADEKLFTAYIGSIERT